MTSSFAVITIMYCLLLHLLHTVQCIHHVTTMYVKMEALADCTSLSTCVNAFQISVDHSVKVSKQSSLGITGEVHQSIIVCSINMSSQTWGLLLCIPKFTLSNCIQVLYNLRNMLNEVA